MPRADARTSSCAPRTRSPAARAPPLPALADLAGVLEQWTGFSARTVAPADGEVIQAAIAKLRWMVEGLGKKQAPAADEETMKSCAP